LEVPAKITQLCALAYEAITSATILFSSGFIFIACIGASPSGPERLVLGLIMLASLQGYYSWCWVKKGHSLAQRAWGLRIESDVGANLTILQSVLRFWLATTLNISLISIFTLFFNKRNQLAQDIFLGFTIAPTQRE
jgi:uncharacterized RDD family membrane protein YckC